MTEFQISQFAFGGFALFDTCKVSNPEFASFALISSSRSARSCFARMRRCLPLDLTVGVLDLLSIPSALSIVFFSSLYSFWSR